MRAWLSRWFPYGLFFLLAFLTFWGRWQGRTPFIDLGVDAGRVATYAAWCDYPEFFSHRPPQWGAICVHSHIALVNLLRVIEDGVGDFGTATVVLLIPVVFLQLTGFYWVGKLLLQYQGWALLYTFLQLPLVWIRFPEGTHWGIYDDPWARHLHQAVLPFLWWWALKSVDRPRVWPWILLVNGMASVLHVRNGGTWAVALWIGFMLLLPKVVRDYRGRIGYAVTLTLVNMLFFVPAARYFFRGAFDGGSVSWNEMMERFGLEWMAAPFLFVLYWALLPRVPVLFTAFLGVWWLRRETSEVDRLRLRMLAGWALAILGISLGLHMASPWLSWAIYRMNFVRGSRFLIPIALTLAFWFLVRFVRKRRREVFSASLSGYLVPAVLWVPIAALGAYPLTLWLAEIRDIERFLNLRAVALTLRVMDLVPDPDRALWVRPYMRLALQTVLDLGVLFGSLMVLGLGLVVVTRLQKRQVGQGGPKSWTWMAEHLPKIAILSLLSMSILWVWAHSEGGAMALLRTGLQTTKPRPLSPAFRRLYVEAIPKLVPPKATVFTTDPYPWEIGYVSLRNYQGATLDIRRVVRWNTEHVQDPEQRAKVWLALARKYHAIYMVTVDIPVEIWQRNSAVQVLYGQDTAVLLRIVATSLKEDR